MVKGVAGREPWHLEMSEAGTNARLSDILAAIGLVQLGRLEGFLDRRRALAERYLREFDEVPGLVPPRERFAGESACPLQRLPRDANLHVLRERR